MESRISRFAIGIGESSWGLNLSLVVFGGPIEFFWVSSMDLLLQSLPRLHYLCAKIWLCTVGIHFCNSNLPWVMCSIGVDCVLQHMWKLIRSGFCSPSNPSISNSSFMLAGKSWSVERAKEDLDLVFYPTNICNVATLASRSMDWWVLRT